MIKLIAAEKLFLTALVYNAKVPMSPLSRVNNYYYKLIDVQQDNLAIILNNFSWRYKITIFLKLKIIKIKHLSDCGLYGREYMTEEDVCMHNCEVIKNDI